VKKPYIENPESFRRKDAMLMLEYWSNFLRRNWSIIVFLFFGQMRSSLQCGECHRERITYEAFSTLSLPLPEASDFVVTVVACLLPTDIKYLLTNKMEEEKNAQEESLYLARKDTLIIDYFENFHINQVKEKPIRLHLKMSYHSRIQDLLHRLQGYSDLELIDPAQDLTEILFYDHYESRKRRVQGFLDPHQVISSLKFREKDMIGAIEVLTPKGKRVI